MPVQSPAAACVLHAARISAEVRRELFNETNRDEVTADLLAWLERVLAPR